MGVLEIAARVLGTVVVAACALMILLYAFRDRLIFHPERGPHLGGPPPDSGLESVFLDGMAGARIEAWTARAAPGARTVLLLHGNGGSLQNMLGRIEAIRALGMGVVAVDYNGFGRSGGSPSETALELNAEAAWGLALSQGASPWDVAIWGYSMGGYPATCLAFSHRQYNNPLMLDSTFTRIADAAPAYGPLLGLAGPPILRDSFDVTTRLVSLSADSLVILHSPDDEVVPYELGLRNFAAYDGGLKELVVLRGKHTDFELNRESYEGAMGRHLVRTLIAEAGPDEEGAGGPDGYGGPEGAFGPDGSGGPEEGRTAPALPSPKSGPDRAGNPHQDGGGDPVAGGP
jgi:pimeloyl-ACP methyl ester carboxylesterase